MRKSIFILMLLVPALILAQPAKMGRHACGPGLMQGESGGHHMLWSKLELTDAQKEQLAALRLEHEKRCIPLHAETKLARIELEEAIRNDASERNVEKAVTQLIEKKNELFKLRIKHRLDMRSVLTDAQKAMLKEMRLDCPMGGRQGGKRHPMPRRSGQGPGMMQRHRNL